MKKLLISFLFLFISFSIFSKDFDSCFNSFYNKISFENIDCSGLSFDQKTILYNTFKEDATTSFLLNTFIGLGSGSFYQKQYTHGFIALSLDVLGICLCSFNSFLPPKTYYYDNGKPFIGPNNDLITSGIIVLCISRVYQMITPYILSNIKNKEFKDYLFSISLDSNKIIVSTNIKL